jgi:putative phage-type endonuclease
MKIIPLQQSTKEWHEYRKTRVMASDCPIVLKQSPYPNATPYKLWQRKLGLIPEQEETPAMTRGKELEPIAREMFCRETGLEMTPIVCESDTYEWMAASLDGISNSGKRLLEIKCNGKKNHDLALDGKVPDSHWLQMQQQMFVSGAELGFYYSFDGEKGKTIEVPFDAVAFDSKIPALYEFWRGLILLEAPALTDRDYKDMASDKVWQTLADKYLHLDIDIKSKEKEKDEVRRQLIQLCGDDNCKGNGIKLLKTITRGRIQYDDIEILKEVDLEQHRKPSTTSWRVYIENPTSLPPIA